ncbi:PREDICTED: transmembrane 4 L6 family member 1 [Pterocles gutturalis]|nr:PREDICTED: transmembrane 4 L6 family member 1 [Pterocles gutturalis]
MCFERRARCIGYKLLILALLSIVANILLYFPNGETRYASEHHLGKYVECLHGILGGGLLVLLPAVVFIGLHNDDCCGCFGHEHCGKGCAMLSSVLAAVVGILGSGYCIIISALGLSHGPYCFTHLERNWIYPFTESSGGYLFEYNRWSECQEPQNIVQWNVTLFSILLVLGGIEFILCFIQIINGILGGLCGLCCRHEEVIPQRSRSAREPEGFSLRGPCGHRHSDAAETDTPGGGGLCRSLKPLLRSVVQFRGRLLVLTVLL